MKQNRINEHAELNIKYRLMPVNSLQNYTDFPSKSTDVNVNKQSGPELCQVKVITVSMCEIRTIHVNG